MAKTEFKVTESESELTGTEFTEKKRKRKIERRGKKRNLKDTRVPANNETEKKNNLLIQIILFFK